MTKCIITLLTTLILAIYTSAKPIAKPPTCHSGLHILIARGSTISTDRSEKASEFGDVVVAKIPNSTWVNVEYPASLFNGDYDDSVAKGVRDTEAKIKEYVALCGQHSRLALVGYSQGAQVMTDLLAGPALFDRSYRKPKPLDQAYRKYIKAVVVFADPTFRAHQTFDAGSAQKSGMMARSNTGLAFLKTYSKVLRSYCDARDWFCAHGKKMTSENGAPSKLRVMADFLNNVGDNIRRVDVHYQTIKKHEQDAVDFMARLAKVD